MAGHQQTRASAPTGERVAAELRERITTGLLLPGTPLRDATLAAELGVARHTLRGALRLLEFEGLVDHTMHKGAVVKRLSTAEAHDIYRIRRVLELSAVEHSAVALQPMLDELHLRVQAAEAAVACRDWAQVGTASLRFHQALVALLDSRGIDQFFLGVLAQLRLAFTAMQDEARWHVPWVPRDREICDLVLGGRRDRAAALLLQYLDDSERAVLDVVRAKDAENHGPTWRRTAPGTQQEA